MADIGTVDEIRKWAEYEGSEVTEMELISQFRCNGSNGYLAWVDDLLEYQGEQHYHPVEFFGGEEAYKELVARDERKARLCKENGVRLVYWKFDEPITKSKLCKKIAETG